MVSGRRTITRGRPAHDDLEHRASGSAGLEPENALRSFHRAASEGADALELDLRVTQDGRLVALHDPIVDRTTDGTGPIHELTLAEVRELDGGIGERIPTFEEVLGATTLPPHAELKVVEAVGRLARLVSGAAIGRLTPISFDARALHRLKRLLPDLPVGLIFSGAAPGAGGRARSLGASLASLEVAHLSVEAVERCRRAGLKVTAWTVNEPQQMRQAMELGVDGIVTAQTC